MRVSTLNVIASGDDTHAVFGCATMVATTVMPDGTIRTSTKKLGQAEMDLLTMWLIDVAKMHE